jgi:hypothetical protein
MPYCEMYQNRRHLSETLELTSYNVLLPLPKFKSYPFRRYTLNLGVSRIYAVNGFFRFCAAKRDSWRAALVETTAQVTRNETPHDSLCMALVISVSLVHGKHQSVNNNVAGDMPAPRRAPKADGSPSAFCISDARRARRLIIPAHILHWQAQKLWRANETAHICIYRERKSTRETERFLFLGKISATPHPPALGMQLHVISCYWRSRKVLRAID